MKRLAFLLNFDFYFMLFAAYLLGNGWSKRETTFLTAEDGLGYQLGIVGGSMMLLLLLYPIRKHTRFMRNWGPIKYWFRIHMLLGIAGPVLILYHANFGMGSINSNIALFCMLIVAGSGLFGRFFYARIHDGLYGKKLQLADLKKNIDELKQSLDSEGFDQSNTRMEQFVLRDRSLLGMLIIKPFIAINTYLMFRKQLSIVKQSSSDNQKKQSINELLKTHRMALLDIFGFMIYERLFSLWHVLHIPLFVMLIISGIVHVFATHLY